MKFKVKKIEIFKTLSHLQGIVDKKNTLPILSNILIEAQSNYLTLSSTDMDISIVEKIKCNVEEEGATTINSQILYDIVRKLDDDCEIEIISNNGKLIIPKKTIYELSKLLSDTDQDIEILINTNKIIFLIDNLVFISKLIDGSFPDYKRVIPKDNNNVLEVHREKLLSAVDRVSTISNEKSPVIKIKLLKNIINLNTINTENSTATEDLKLSYDGDEFEIGFNSKYVMDIVNNLEDDIISIKFKDGSSPIIAQEKSNSNLVYVLMPMRV